jgi:hypothetical protein
MLIPRQGRFVFLALLLPLLVPGLAAADIPTWLPRYDLDIRLDTDHGLVQVRERVTWFNRHQRPAAEIVFNAHSHYQVPDSKIGFMAKMTELLRVSPGEAISTAGPPLQVQKITRDGKPLDFSFQHPNRITHPDGPPDEDPEAAKRFARRVEEETDTALVVCLPRPVGVGESVTLEMEFTLHLPQKQGRWGQWQGVTFLATWLPVLAYYDECGWQPTPFIPWHQPFFNEAGLYSARLTLPCQHKIGCSAVITAEKDLGNGFKQVDFSPCCTRDFALVCSARFQEFVGNAGGVTVRCVAFPEHEHYARAMVRWVCEALPVYNRWFGPYPYAQFTIAESYFGWNGNECGALVLIDERIFGMPHLAGSFVEYLISHELLHQWWYNVVGTNGYCETWMDEAVVTHFTHVLMDKKHGRNNPLLRYPQGFGWLPNIHRDSYRNYSYLGAIGRGDAMPTVQEMQEYGHLANLLSMCYDRGSRIVGMIADRMGETAFFDFMRGVYTKYYFRILRVEDFRRELEAYTGQSWKEFFDRWLYDKGLTDWCVDKVKVTPIKELLSEPGYTPSFLAALRREKTRGCKVTVWVKQKAEYNEPTVLGISLKGGDHYEIRLPIDPQAGVLRLDELQACIEPLAPNHVRVDIVLPSTPAQITVDPDQVLLDRDPSNNHWKPLTRVRFTPLYTIFEETDVTTAYDRWNLLFGPGIFFPAFEDPWYTRGPMLGLRAGLYRTQHFAGGGYLGYRSDYRDLVAGFDGLIDHWPEHRTQIGFNAEWSLTPVGGNDDGRHSSRGSLFGRYVFDYGSSLYLPPMRYVEVFGTVQNDPLPLPRHTEPGADHFDQQSALGIHYHQDYLTPYWYPEGGFKLDATYANGLPIFGERQAFYSVNGQLSYIQGLPSWLGPLSETQLAARVYGAAGLPDKGQYFTLGGGKLFRGYDLNERQGSLVWVASVEWRVPLVRRVNWDCFDHIVGIRNIYGAVFYDVGDAYLRGHSLGPVAHAVGGGLRVELAWFSMIERSTLRFDVAQTLNGSAPLQFWFGVGVPF